MIRYATTRTRADQSRIALAVGEAFQWYARMTREELLLPWDVEFSNALHQLVLIAEIKRRNVSRYTYRHCKTDKSEIDRMLVEAERRGVPCGYIVEFDEGIFIRRITREWLDSEQVVVTTITRNDRPQVPPKPAYQWSNADGAKLWLRVC